MPASKPGPAIRDLRILWLAVFCLMFGFGIYSSTFFNFATEVLKIGPRQIGWVEAVRETPGLLCVIAAALTMGISEPLLGAMMMFLMAIGLGAYARVSSIHTLMIWSFVWSVGMHTWMPISSSLSMHLAEEGSKGKRLGQTAGAGSFGTLLGMAAVLIINYRIGYHTWYIIGAGAMLIGAVVMLFLRRDIGQTEKPRFVMRPKYRLYYVLTLLEGCRKQVFFTFSVYALTKVYDVKVQTIALLMVINTVVNMIGAPWVGRMIDRVGERRLLMTSYSALIFVFIGYATAGRAWALCVLYCLDNLFYLSTACLTTYLQKIAPPEDLMPSLSMGVTFNHAAAVLVPLIGGYLWARFTYPVTFFGGAVVVAISLVLASRVPRYKAVKTAE